MALDGGCRCGEIRYRISGEKTPPVYCCHCLFCQTWTGSAFSQQAIVKKEMISLTDGSPIKFQKENLNGSMSTQFVCSNCHTRLWNENSGRPGLVLIRAGTLDESNRLVPRAHIWTSRKQTWVAIAEDLPQWSENAPDADFAAALNEVQP